MFEHTHFKRGYDTTYLCGDTPKNPNKSKNSGDNGDNGDKHRTSTTYSHDKSHHLRPVPSTELKIPRLQETISSSPRPAKEKQQLQNRHLQLAISQPQFYSPESRENSYIGHEQYFPHHTPFALADAGFFLDHHQQHQSTDAVRCFHCSIGLGNWVPDDIPWVEHARHAPKCDFLNAEMGERFVEQVTDSFKNEKAFKESCEPYTKDNQSLIFANFQKQYPDVFKTLDQIYNRPNRGMEQVKKAILHWHYTEGSLGKIAPRASNILSILNDNQLPVNGSSQSMRLLDQPVENLFPKDIREQLEVLEMIKSERTSLFQKATKQRQARKLQEYQKSLAESSTISPIEIADKSPLEKPTRMTETSEKQQEVSGNQKLTLRLRLRELNIED